MDFNYFGVGSFVKPYDFKNKERCVKSYVNYMLNRLQSMFKYEGLPDTIPQKMIELYIMTNGHSVIVEHEDNLYVCFGNWGGEPNEYYIPRNYIVANPYLNLFKTFTIGEDCVLAHNDSLYYGLMPMMERYATLLVENDITMRMVDINSRISALIDAPDDPTYASAQKYLSDIEAGENGVIASNKFFDGIRSQPYGEHNYQRLTDLIEFHQYMKASWFNELGLNANYNMKREAITSNEAQLNDDMLMPLIDDMFNCRKKWIDEVNEMFGTEWSVDWSSAWETNLHESELADDLLEAQIDSERSEVGDDGVESENEESSGEDDVSEPDKPDDE